MAKQFKIKDWLSSFLASRELDAPDGRHLYSYHATPDEFLTLEEGLKQDMALAYRLGYSTPFRLWYDVPSFDAVFVLYAALCWQQRYGGTTWSYDVILNGLNVFLPTPSLELKDIIEKGLHFWGLDKNKRGYVYLGAIAREAGLPQKLLTENRGAVGRLLHSVLREALRSGQSGNIITSWIKSCETILPQSYRNEEIIDLLADSINAILNIKKNLCASTLEEVMAELDEKTPDWRSCFPLPLYDDTARDLLNRLLEDAASSTQTVQTGSPVSAVRSLIRKAGQGWDILARLNIPSRIETGIRQDRPRVLSMSITSGQSSFESVLKKHADSKFYFFQQKKNVTFFNPDAVQEIIVRYMAPSGFCLTHTCPGGAELDSELPWIFEGEQYGYRFRQQGGGSVRGTVCYVALAPGWEAENAEDLGPLLGTDRHIHRMTHSGRLKKDNLEFPIRTSELFSEEYDWSRDNRFWDVEVLHPSLAFRGIPKVVASLCGMKKISHGKILQKTAGMEDFIPLSSSNTPVGVAQVWFKANSGASLRSRMLLLPMKASISLSADEEGNGLLCLENWSAETATFDQPQPGLDLVCRPQGDSLELAFKTLPGHVPPATVDLRVSWRNNPQPACIRIPFPQTGAHLFNADSQEILSSRQICALHLHGLRLYCFSVGVHHIVLRLSLSDKKLDYPLEIHEHCTVIRLIDWQNALLEMLALTNGLDDYVSLDILFDSQKVAGWKVARYESCLFPEGMDAVLALSEFGIRPSRGYAMKALPLDHPELGPMLLEESLNEDGTASGKWDLSEVLDRPGPWLIFDDTEGTSLRPLVWTVDGDIDETSRNRLQIAIDEKDKEARLQALLSCVAVMEHDLDAPEWTTLLALLDCLKNQPLSTLEIWQALLRSPLIMAMIALHSGISFQSVTSRIETEFPFLWNFISRQNWSAASQCIKHYFEKLIPGQMAFSIWQDHMQKTMENLGSCCPSVNALVHIAIPLPCHEQELKKIEYFSLAKTQKILFQDDSSLLQALLHTHADDDYWPMTFESLVNYERHNDNVRPFLSFSQGHRNSVIGLPVLLTLQSFEPRLAFFSVPPDQNTVFHIREHLHFDTEWFEQASTFTACSCASVRFIIKES